MIEFRLQTSLVIHLTLIAVTFQQRVVFTHGFSVQRSLTFRPTALRNLPRKHAFLDDPGPEHTNSDVPLLLIEATSQVPKDLVIKKNIFESEYSSSIAEVAKDDEFDAIDDFENDIENGRKLILGLLWTIALLSALDRVAMSVALVPMSLEFEMSDTMKGSISSLFSVGYGLAIIPAGLLVAQLSPKLVLAGGIALWSLATIATPDSANLLTLTVGSTMAPLLLARACVGAGESLVLPAIQRFLTVWTSSNQKGSGKKFFA
jgi:Major Facilitator Superfamily